MMYDQAMGLTIFAITPAVSKLGRKFNNWLEKARKNSTLLDDALTKFGRPAADKADDVSRSNSKKKGNSGSADARRPMTGEDWEHDFKQKYGENNVYRAPNGNHIGSIDICSTIRSC